MTARNYLSAITAIIDRVIETQSQAIEQAGKVVANAMINNKQLWAFGTGHSHILAEELFNRAGGLDGVHAILEPSLMLHEDPLKSTLLERLPGLAEVLLTVHDVQLGDVVIIASNSGRNPVPVELAEQVRQRGAQVVAVTSIAHSQSVPSRATSGRRLFEAADVTIDNGGVPGDAVLDIAGCTERVGATSTVTGALIAQAIISEATALLAQSGHTPPVLRSYNADG